MALVSQFSVTPSCSSCCDLPGLVFHVNPLLEQFDSTVPFTCSMIELSVQIKSQHAFFDCVAQYIGNIHSLLLAQIGSYFDQFSSLAATFNDHHVHSYYIYTSKCPSFILRSSVHEAFHVTAHSLCKDLVKCRQNVAVIFQLTLVQLVTGNSCTTNVVYI